MKKLLLSLLVPFLFNIVAYGQFFVSEGQPCVWGPRAKLDTILFAPETAMPFDRCFYLQFRVPGAPKIDYFTVLPIDQSGNKAVNRRDYRTFLKSTFGSLAKGKENMTWEEFSHPDHKMLRLFSEIKINSDGKNSDVFLKISPLEPNRQYQVILLTRDEAALDRLTLIENLLLSTVTLPNPNSATFTTAKNDFTTMHANRVQNRFKFRDLTYEEFAHETFPCDKKLSLETKASEIIQGYRDDKSDTAYSYTRGIRVFLVPPSVNFTDQMIPGLAADQSATIWSHRGLENLSPKLLLMQMKEEGTKDIQGNVVNYMTAGTYRLFVQVTDSVVEGRRHIAHEQTLFDTLALVTWSASPDGAGMGSFTTDSLPDPCKDLLFPAYQKFTAAEAKIKELTEAELSVFDADCFQWVMKRATQCPCEKEGIKDLTQKDDLLRTIAFFFSPSALRLTQLQAGLISLKTPFEVIKQTDWSARISNIKTSVAQLRELREFILKTRATAEKATPCLESEITHLTELETRLTSLAAQYQIIFLHLQKRQDELVKQYDLYNAAPIGNGSTSVLEFLSAHKFRIVPDFGLVGVWKGQGAKFQDLVPYLGFHINFRSIDKSIQMKDVKYKSWRHYFSFMGGITLRSMKIEGKREDFFANNNLITGLGFRLNNYLRITGGVIWFRTVDKNPLSTDKPIGFSPFTGLSLDLELQSLFGGLQKLFQ